MLEAAPLDVVGCCALEPSALFLNDLLEHSLESNPVYYT